MNPAQLDLKAEIMRLKKQRNAVILAHNYQTADIQDIADHVGDSLGLAYAAKNTDADVIVFCGVHFMAETAKLVNPDKVVVLPDVNAGCSLADSCEAKDLAAFLQQNADKNYYVIAYINCSAEVKALCDCICTSGNAELIVNAAPKDRPILFVPDQNLGSWVMQKTGREMDLWAGACHVHMEFSRDAILKARTQHPDALVVAHPECTPAVRMLADEVCSTERMISFCQSSEAKKFIVVTESGMLHRLQKIMPDKQFIAGPTANCACSDCKYMKLNTLQKIAACMADLQPQIELPEQLLQRAAAPLLRMLELSKK